jgi:hypothetical protein
LQHSLHEHEVEPVGGEADEGDRQHHREHRLILIGPEIYRHYYLDMTIRIDSKGS